MAEKDDIAEKQEKEREPWSPRIERTPLFINSAEYERGLGEESRAPDIEISDEEPQDSSEHASPSVPDPVSTPVV
jgi:hypothetical protein